MHSRKPKLGQNFLIDQNASLSIVEALGDISARTVVEIGPGRGAITALLALRARPRCTRRHVPRPRVHRNLLVPADSRFTSAQRSDIEHAPM